MCSNASKAVNKAKLTDSLRKALRAKCAPAAAVGDVMGAWFFASSWVSVRSADFVPKTRLTGIRVFRFVAGLAVSFLVAFGSKR